MDTPAKRCKTCLRDLPLDAFHKNIPMPDGHVNFCIECVNAKRRQKRADDPEAAKEADRQRYIRDKKRINERNNGYYARNPQPTIDRATKWQKENRERHNTYGRERHLRKRDADIKKRKENYARNPGSLARLREQQRRYSSSHPERARISSHRRRSRKQELPYTFTAAEWQECLNYWQGRCAYCGNPPGLLPGMELTMDHFIPIHDRRPDNPGTVAVNMLPACKSCNSTKSKRDPIEFLQDKFGERKAKQILKRIGDYFASLG